MDENSSMPIMLDFILAMGYKVITETIGWDTICEESVYYVCQS